MTRLLVAYVVAIGPIAFVMGLVAVECKRGIQRTYRRWLVQLEQERCDLAHAPIYCGRVRE